jgi:hypothetical protein
VRPFWWREPGRAEPFERHNQCKELVNGQNTRTLSAIPIGLIVSEGTVVNRPASHNDPDIPHFYGEKPLSGWKAVIDRVHAAGGIMAPQLWHMGVVAPKDTGWLPPAPFEGPSGYVAPGRIGGVAMTESDIAGTIQAFAQAAAESKALVFRNPYLPPLSECIPPTKGTTHEAPCALLFHLRPYLSSRAGDR